MCRGFKALARHLVLLGAAVGIVGCDHVSKHVAIEVLAGEPTKSYLFDTVRLSYAENAGSFLGWGADLPESARFVIFTLGAGTLLALLVAYAVHARWSGASRVGVAMVAAGGASNLVDRLSDGRVVDFLNVGIGTIRTGIFNVADMAIMAGAALLLLGGYARGKRRTT